MKKFIDKLVTLAVEKAYVLKIVLILVASSILFISYLFFETNDYISVQTEVIKNNKKTFAYIHENHHSIHYFSLYQLQKQQN